MPSQITHLAVAKLFLVKHPYVIKNVQRFLDGNVAPDLNSNKAESHCGDRSEKNDIVKLNAQKVNPEKFIKTHDMSDDFNKGQYLHLLVDYNYYNKFLLWYFKQVKRGEQVNADMYETTRRDDAYLRDKYQVSYGDTTLAKELQKLNDEWDEDYVYKRRAPGYHFFIPYNLSAIDAFIEEMSENTFTEKC